MNQCDGCRRGLPVVNGRHDLTGTTGSYPGEQIGCTAHLYQPNTALEQVAQMDRASGKSAEVEDTEGRGFESHLAQVAVPE